MTKNLLLLFVSLMSFNTFAQRELTFPQPGPVMNNSEAKLHVGITGGVVNPEGRYGAAPTYGIDIGLQPYIPFSLGFELFGSKADSPNNAEDFDSTTLLVRGNYNFGGTIPVLRHSYVGAGIGPVYLENRVILGFAPIIAGFDIPLNEKPDNFVSLGLNAKYLMTEGSTPDSSTLNGVIKYWY